MRRSNPAQVELDQSRPLLPRRLAGAKRRLRVGGDEAECDGCGGAHPLIGSVAAREGAERLERTGDRGRQPAARRCTRTHQLQEGEEAADLGLGVVTLGGGREEELTVDLEIEEGWVEFPSRAEHGERGESMRAECRPL